VLLTLGLLMLTIYWGARMHRALLSRATLAKFNAEQVHPADEPTASALPARRPDFTLWSPKRIQDYELSLAAHFSPAIAVLRIPKIDLDVPVLEGTDDLTLNRAVGRIAGTAKPGEDGNIGIAGHRDGFFRTLKDVGPGDRIDLVTSQGEEPYIVDRVTIVDPSDVSVLRPRSRRSLTLVTCYPFYYVGSAPKRYIVEASMPDTALAELDVKQRRVSKLEIQKRTPVVNSLQTIRATHTTTERR
jgi:sortase A